MNSESSAVSRLRPADKTGSPEEAARPEGRLLYFPSPSHNEVEAQPRSGFEAAGRSRAYLLAEFAVLFIGIPLTLFFRVGLLLPLLPLLWGVAGVALLLLLLDPSFDRRQLWNGKPLAGQLAPMLGLFAVGAVVITVLVRVYAPGLFLGMMRHQPRLWTGIMLSYPFVSVYPQSVIYRAFFFHRYRRLLQPHPEKQPWLQIAASAFSFAFVHIVFHNWIAVALTFVGGVLFALRYVRTRSLCVSFVEHTLYGWLLFTVGLGQFFITKMV